MNGRGDAGSGSEMMSIAIEIFGAVMLVVL